MKKKDTVSLCEGDVQLLIMVKCDIYRVAAIPNIAVYHSEADLLMLTNSLFLHEFEIKTSRADLLSELRAIKYKEKGPISNIYDRAVPEKSRKHYCFDRMFNKLRVDNCIGAPNYYWMVIPEGICDISELPSYAGVMVFKYIGGSFDGSIDNYSLDVVRKAPRLHHNKIPEHFIMRFLLRCSDALWNEIRGNRSNKMFRRGTVNE